MGPQTLLKDGKYSYVDKDDKWSAIVDNTLSIQFEHTIGITETGKEIFTLPDNDFPDVWVDVLCEREKEWMMKWFPHKVEERTDRKMNTFRFGG